MSYKGHVLSQSLETLIIFSLAVSSYERFLVFYFLRGKAYPCLSYFLRTIVKVWIFEESCYGKLKYFPDTLRKFLKGKQKTFIQASSRDSGWGLWSSESFGSPNVWQTSPTLFLSTFYWIWYIQFLVKSQIIYKNSSTEFYFTF